MTKELAHPAAGHISLSALFDALSDPLRRKIVQQLAEQGESNCSGFLELTSKTNLSYHLARMREAGLTRTRVEGTSYYVRLRVDELEERFPGLLGTVLASITAEERPAPARKTKVASKRVASKQGSARKKGAA